MIVTIDGPAGAGKSTVARRLAERLGFRFLDTGEMYRAVALAGLRHGVEWRDGEQLAELAERLDLRVEGGRVLLGGEDVTDAVRSSEVTAVTRFAADNPRVRRWLVELQRRRNAPGDACATSKRAAKRLRSRKCSPHSSGATPRTPNVPSARWRRPKTP